MMKTKSLKKENDITVALLSIVVGILFCVYNVAVLKYIVIGIGVLLIFKGIIDASKYKKTVEGIIEIIIGIIFIVCAFAIVKILSIVLGVMVLIWGLVNIKYISKNNIISTIKVICAIILGIILALGYLYPVKALFIAIGIVAIINGIVILIQQ